MNFIEFLYKIIENHSGMPRTKVIQLEKEALLKSDEWKEGDGKIAKLFGQWNEHIVIKTILAILIIFVNKSLLSTTRAFEGEYDDE